MVTVTGQGPVLSDNPEFTVFDNFNKSVTVTTTYEDVDPDAQITRTVKAVEFEDVGGEVRYYYVVTDECKMAPLFGYMMQGKTFSTNLNGNGKLGSSCDVSRVSNGDMLWTHPCEQRGTWKLFAHTNLSTPDGNPTFNVTSDHKHGVDNFIQDFHIGNTDNQNIACGPTNDGFGTHARFSASYYGEKATFVTVLMPLKCIEPNFPPVDSLRVYAKSDSTYSLSTLKNLGKDSCTHIHIVQGVSHRDTILKTG